jgi:putative protein-disulfide isomerase
MPKTRSSKDWRVFYACYISAMKLYYVHDPMCSWCWGFSPTRQIVRENLPDGIEWISLLGGLAPDSDESMTDETKGYVQKAWRTIQERIPGTEFNFDFWNKCAPRRSTYPACRAVIAARNTSADSELSYILALQKAYYLRAMNPSDTDTHLTLANELGLDASVFEQHLLDPKTHQTLLDEIAFARSIGGDSFPSLIIVDAQNQAHSLKIHYTDPQRILDDIQQHLC